MQNIIKKIIVFIALAGPLISFGAIGKVFTNPATNNVTTLPDYASTTFHGQAQTTGTDPKYWIPDPGPQCSNGVDDDGDGKTDYPTDTQCTGSQDYNESAAGTQPKNIYNVGLGYFRYSKIEIPPIFCNDIFGSNMRSTKEIWFYGAGVNFNYTVTDLEPNTKYAYCAVVSNDASYKPTDIQYGGVYTFTTLPCPTCDQTTINTLSPSGITSSSAYLKGDYNSTKPTKTYFEYKKNLPIPVNPPAGYVPPAWIKVNSQTHGAGSSGGLTYSVSGLTQTTPYIFRAVIEEKNICPLSFTGTYPDCVGNGSTGLSCPVGFNANGFTANGNIKCTGVNQANTYASPEYGSDFTFTTTVQNNGGSSSNNTSSTSGVTYGNTGWTYSNSSSGNNGGTLTPQCSNSIDDDGDDAIDFPDDPECASANDYSESIPGEQTGGFTTPQCSNGIDDDGDGKIDYPADPQCVSADDYSESIAGGQTGGTLTPQCSDTLDNDGDGLIDYPNDPQCTTANDYSESLSGGQTSQGNTSGGYLTPQCGNGTDDDGDGLIDYPNDPQCTSVTDYSESIAGGQTGGQYGDMLGNPFSGSGTIGGGIFGPFIGNGGSNGSNTNGGNNNGNGGNSSGTDGNPNLGTGPNTVLPPPKIGDHIAPLSDAIVRYHEGVETVFTRQIKNYPGFAKLYGYQDGEDLQQFADDLSHVFAQAFGYYTGGGREIRVSLPDIAAYEFGLKDGKLAVYEYYDGYLTGIAVVTDKLKTKYGYEYYFQGH